MVLVFVVGTGLAVGIAVALLARRWPVIAAPKVSGETIATGVVEHPKFADHFRKRFDPKEQYRGHSPATAAIPLNPEP